MTDAELFLRFYRRCVEIADSRITLVLERGSSRERQLLSTLIVKLLSVINPPQLLRVGTFQRLQLLDLIAGKLPRAGVDIPIRVYVFVKNKTSERGLRFRHVGARVPDDERDLVGSTLGGQRPLARIIGELDEKDHGDEHQGGNEACCRSASSSPIEADLVLFPVP